MSSCCPWQPASWPALSNAPAFSTRRSSRCTDLMHCVEWPKTSAASWTSNRSWPAWSTTRWCCSGVRAAVVQEGFDTVCTAPLFDGTELLGLLNIYHDRPREWTDDELDTLAALATQAGVAIKTAQNYTQMATWAAQLQSIQQLGARLNRLTSVHEIGLAIATELRQLLDYHNVRVYRLYGDDLIPVAMQGQVGEYVDETPEQLRIKVG